MIEKDKYYTPIPEELCIGFEYSYSVGTKEGPWNSIEIENGMEIDDFISDYERGIPQRVKYLNKEDIESLGFIREDKDFNKYPEDGGYCGHIFSKLVERFYFHDREKFKGMCICTDFNNHYLTIEYGDLNSYGCNYKFKGIIKNKSELKRLLKQLCIS